VYWRCFGFDLPLVFSFYQIILAQSCLFFKTLLMRFRYQAQKRVKSTPMKGEFAVRWVSRAGQGAITASTVLAEALGAQGYAVQSFPDFGAEKRGAAVTVYNRFAKTPLYDASHPTKTDAIIILDTTLLESGEVALDTLLASLKPEGFLLVNTPSTKLPFTSKVQTYTLDASGISQAEIGRPIPNVPLLGALVTLGQLGDTPQIKAYLKKYLTQQLGETLATGNLRAFTRGCTAYSPR
jgi:pyruvate ferredoxin oxidoreductase gamma subunit